jgi:predicted nucleic acid-binding protein
VLYVDSSALSKQYLQEVGSARLGARLEEAARSRTPVLTSFLTYAEIHTMLGRKLREGSLLPADYHFAVSRFESDWRSYFVLVEVDQRVLNLVPDLVNRHPLKASDALQLASALWTSQFAQRGAERARQPRMLFATADKQLGSAAEHEQLLVFNPEIP